jgi:hypothetical protein
VYAFHDTTPANTSKLTEGNSDDGWITTTLTMSSVRHPAPMASNERDAPTEWIQLLTNCSHRQGEVMIDRSRTSPSSFRAPPEPDQLWSRTVQRQAAELAVPQTIRIHRADTALSFGIGNSQRCGNHIARSKAKQIPNA